MRFWFCTYKDVKVGDHFNSVKIQKQAETLHDLLYVYVSTDENGIITEIHKTEKHK